MKQPTSNCRDCISQGKSIFGCLLDSQVALLDHEKTSHEYRRGQIIFYEGNPAFAMYCICSGMVKLSKMFRNGEQRVIRLLGPGEITGYRALFAEEPYGATAEAVETSMVCAIPKSALLNLVHESPALALKFLSKVSVELRVSEEQMLSFAENSVRQRLAQLLLSLLGTDAASKKGPHEIKSHLSRSEMAQMIGTTPETFSRTLHDFAAKGLVLLMDSDICVRDLTKVQRIAGGLMNGFDSDQGKS